MALASPAPIVWGSAAPFKGAVLASLAVFRIGDKFTAVGIGASPPLTVRFSADRLTELKLGWLEDSLANRTPPCDHMGVAF